MTLTVKNLKELLANQPDDAEIYIDLQDDLVDEGPWRFSVRPLEGMDLKMRSVKDNKVATRPCKETSGAKKAVILI